MTLIPALVSVDDLPVTNPFFLEDEVTAAVLALKADPDSLTAYARLSAYKFLDVDLLCTSAFRARNGHTRLTYAVADYRQGAEALDEVLAPTMRIFGREIRSQIPDAIRLFRRAHPIGADGKWWSGSKFDALREGVTQEDASIFSAMVPKENILMRTRTTFGKGGTCPAEFIVDPTGLDIQPIS